MAVWSSAETSGLVPNTTSSGFMAVSFQLMESENARAALDGVRLAFSA